MSYTIPRKTTIILIIAAVVGAILFYAAPAEIQPGEYDVLLIVDTPEERIEFMFNVSFILDGDATESMHFVTGTYTNITVTASAHVPIAPTSKLSVAASAEGAPVSAEMIHLILSNDGDFSEVVRCSRQSGQVFNLEYQPLVRSQYAVMILGVVAILWFTEGISLVATSLLIPVLIVLSDIRTPSAALAPFFDPAVALIFGGFLIGRALTKYELDKRLALLSIPVHVDQQYCFCSNHDSDSFGGHLADSEHGSAGEIWEGVGSGSSLFSHSWRGGKPSWVSTKSPCSYLHHIFSGRRILIHELATLRSAGCAHYAATDMAMDSL
jgi:hypothetical protein